MLSLEEGPVTSPAPDEKGQEFNAYTLTGEHTGTVGALLRFVEQEDGGPQLEDDELLERLRAHIHRGVGTLAVRAKSPADLGRLAMTS
jgi:DNA sulfur modification protein DndE